MKLLERGQPCLRCAKRTTKGPEATRRRFMVEYQEAGRDARDQPRADSVLGPRAQQRIVNRGLWIVVGEWKKNTGWKELQDLSGLQLPVIAMVLSMSRLRDRQGFPASSLPGGKTRAVTFFEDAVRVPKSIFLRVCVH